MTFQLTTPVAFLIFNRPNTTQRVFNTIRQAKPQQLLVVADGPRTDRSGEAEKCTETRSIIEQIDWDCRVYKNYADINLGCKQRVASGLNWVFEQVEEAIILEDDCLPDPTFFQFCDELLCRYRNDTRIMAIAGNNIIPNQYTDSTSYYFSRYNQIWGWATWKRAWQHYDISMKEWPSLREKSFLKNWFRSSQAVAFWDKKFQTAYNNQIDTWDYAWTFACWTQHALSIIPNVNLVSNIGFGLDATHTTETNSSLANCPSKGMKFPLHHPKMIIRNFDADELIESIMFSLSPLLRFRRKVSYIFNSQY
ncbi:MAG: glycosyltransferase family 2 protein [Acaryochloris sp. RU_4_1]|nr:glycosyltransferase family 2 protein [Acaryochloris sp. RU_4_1]NJR53980.1 glycosyltransferase family 2 protein [Acaryochloris sp. CRU_2_0]